MTVEKIKQMLDACYTAKRIRDRLPPLPEGVAPSYIQVLDTICKLESAGKQVKISDVSDALRLPRPCVTRTIKEMEQKGYLKKQVSGDDGRVTYLSVTEKGAALSEKFDKLYFRVLEKYLDGISDEDADCMVRVIKALDSAMCAGRDELE